MPNRYLTLICDTTASGNELNYATLRIDRKHAEKLLELRQVVKKLNNYRRDFHCIEFFENPCLWWKGDPTQDYESSLEWKRVPEDVAKTFDHATNEDVDAATIKACDTGVVWCAVPRHYEGNEYAETRELTWDQLEKIAKGEDPFE